MKVILRQDLKGVGKAGAIAEVAEGYARNYLLPRGLAQEATSGNLSQMEDRRAAATRRDEKLLAENRELATRLEARPVEIKAKAGERGKLFGAVTNAQIADAIRAQHGIEIDRHKIELDEPVKGTGDHAGSIKLPLGVVAKITVRVSAQ